jgi:arylformamidase
MKIYDVTVPISEELIVYPGDPQVRIERSSVIGQEDAKYNLSTITLGSHTGTHIDSPFHLKS